MVIGKVVVGEWVRCGAVIIAEQTDDADCRLQTEYERKEGMEGQYRMVSYSFKEGYHLLLKIYIYCCISYPDGILMVSITCIEYPYSIPTHPDSTAYFIIIVISFYIE